MNDKQKRILTTLFKRSLDNPELRRKAKKFVEETENQEIKQLYVDTLLHNHESLIRRRKK